MFSKIFAKKFRENYKNVQIRSHPNHGHCNNGHQQEDDHNDDGYYHINCFRILLK